MATCVVSGKLLDPSSQAVSGANLRFSIQNPVMGTISTKAITTTSAADGTWSLAIDQGLTGILSIEYSEDSSLSSSTHAFNLSIPSASTASFGSVWVD